MLDTSATRSVGSGVIFTAKKKCEKCFTNSSLKPGLSLKQENKISVVKIIRIRKVLFNR